jgi:hypothetical protein
MRPITLLVATLGVVATAAFAQPPGGPGFGGPGAPLGANIERLTVLLDLDAYQKQEVERVLKEQGEAVRAQRATHEGAGGERRSFAEMQALREQAREETITKLQGVLTEQQIAKLKLLMEPPAEARLGPASGGDVTTDR